MDSAMEPCRRRDSVHTKMCGDYVGVACVDGSCPIANQEKYAEHGIPVINGCDECNYYKGCEDCALAPES